MFSLYDRQNCETVCGTVKNSNTNLDMLTLTMHCWCRFSVFVGIGCPFFNDETLQNVKSGQPDFGKVQYIKLKKNKKKKK